jgi:hypothetical protein
MSVMTLHVHHEEIISRYNDQTIKDLLYFPQMLIIFLDYFRACSVETTLWNPRNVRGYEVGCRTLSVYLKN